MHNMLCFIGFKCAICNTYCYVKHVMCNVLYVVCNVHCVMIYFCLVLSPHNILFGCVKLAKERRGPEKNVYYLNVTIFDMGNSLILNLVCSFCF